MRKWWAPRWQACSKDVL